VRCHDVAERKLRKKLLKRVYSNGCFYYCSLAQRHGGGSDRHLLFSCKCPFRGSLSNSFSTALLAVNIPSFSEAPSRIFVLPHIPPDPLSNLTHFSLNYLFIYYLSNREGPVLVRLRACHGVCEHEGHR